MEFPKGEQKTKLRLFHFSQFYEVIKFWIRRKGCHPTNVQNIYPCFCLYPLNLWGDEPLIKIRLRLNVSDIISTNERFCLITICFLLITLFKQKLLLKPQVPFNKHRKILTKLLARIGCCFRHQGEFKDNHRFFFQFVEEFCGITPGVMFYNSGNFYNSTVSKHHQGST